MACANYAVTVYGVSFFELLKLGVPTVVFSPYGQRDNRELQEIERQEVALVARDEVDATETLVSLMCNDEQAQRLSQSAKDKFRSSGVDRLCAEVKMLVSP
jgi:UDP-N-acetylglucosamine:LPS N-acetylglucosamine transferase